MKENIEYHDEDTAHKEQFISQSVSVAQFQADPFF